MSVQFSDAVRNAMLDAYEATVGASAVLKLYSGALNANCAAAEPTGMLVTISFPSDWATAAAGGVKSLVSAGNNINTTGTAISYRWYNSAQTVCHEQGTVSATNGGGDLTLDNALLTAGNLLTITGRSITAGNP